MLYVENRGEMFLVVSEMSLNPCMVLSIDGSSHNAVGISMYSSSLYSFDSKCV